MRKTVIAISIILIILAMGIGVYLAWKRSQEILNPPTLGERPVTSNQIFQSTSNGNQGSREPAPKLRIISSQPIFDYWVFGSVTSSQIFYLNQDGKIIRIQNTGSAASEEAVTSESIPNLQSLKASPDGKFVLIKFGDLARSELVLWNAETKVKQALPNASVAAFSPDSKQVAYLEINATSGVSNLMVRDLFGIRPGTRKVFSLRENDFDLSWTLPQQMILISKPSFDYPGEMWSLNLKTQTLNLLGSGQGLMAGWLSDGKTGMKWNTNTNRSPSLTLIQNDGTLTANLDFSTFPDKCLLTQPKFYCALPQVWSSIGEPTLPDDYLKRSVYSKDFIYKIDSNQNSSEAVFTGTEPAIDAVHLKLFDNQLLFINRYDNKLYSLEL